MSFFKTLKKVFTETPDYVPSESYQDMLRRTKKKHNQKLKQWRKDFRNEQNEKERQERIDYKIKKLEKKRGL